jgi:hypothetical protein
MRLTSGTQPGHSQVHNKLARRDLFGSQALEAADNLLQASDHFHLGGFHGAVGQESAKLSEDLVEQGLLALVPRGIEVTKEDQAVIDVSVGQSW